jgi:anaerobic magnesium-protoporphyrin IX monomethyl ester cyclase
MKLMLIQPYLGRKQSPLFPIGLACLAARLTEHELYGLDLNVPPAPSEALRQAVQDFGPEVVLISMRNGDSVWYSDPFCYFPRIQAQIRQIRALAPQAQIIVGGTGFSIFSRVVMTRTPEIDLGILGEAEEMIDDLVTQRKPPAQFPNVVYREGTALKGGVRPGITSLEPYIGPRYDLFPMEPYINTSGGLGVETKRGCPLSCSYCTYPQLSGHRLRLISTDAIVERLRELKERYGATRFHLTDSIFNMPRAHAEEFLRKLIAANLGLKWTAYYHESNFDAEFLDLNLEAGCDKFWFSPDGLTAHALKALGKQQTAAEVKQTWRLLTSRKNIEANFGFFWQYPGMRWRDFGALVGFFLWYRLHNRRDVLIDLNQIRIEPGTPIHAQAVAEGLISADNPLLPTEIPEMMQMFYRRQPRGLFEWTYDIVSYIKKIRRGPAPQDLD